MKMQKCKAELYWSKRTTTKACSGGIVFGNRGKTLRFFLRKLPGKRKYIQKSKEAETDEVREICGDCGGFGVLSFGSHSIGSSQGSENVIQWTG